MNFPSCYFLKAEKQQRTVLVLLHGYNNTRQEMLPICDYLHQQCPNLAIYAPEGNVLSENNVERRQWYRISGFDTDGRRQQKDTSIEEIVKIYDRAGDCLCKAAEELNEDIDTLQHIYGFKDENTYMCGFSQGAMLALWSTLKRKSKIAGCMCLSGFAASANRLEREIISKANVYLLHGKSDEQVQFKCMQYTEKWLKKQNIPVVSVGFDNLGHAVSTEELYYIGNIINKKQP